MCTESKALLKSMARRAERWAGLRSLKPVAIAWEIGNRAVVVECKGLKPCWELFEGRAEVRVGRSRRSMTIIAGQRREMGGYEAPRVSALAAFRRGMMSAVFQRAGILAVRTERL